MKKCFYLLLIPLVLSACSQEDVNPEINGEPANSLSGKPFKWDGVYEIRNGVEVDLTDQQPVTKASATQQFYEITSISPRLTYLGSILTAQSINDGVYKGVSFPAEMKEKVTVSFTLPVRSMEIAPKKSDMQNAVISALGDKSFNGKQSQVFNYKMKQFSYYSELKIAFGANVSVGSIFSINTEVNYGKIKLKTGLFVDFSQIYFSAYMDVPDDGNIFKTEAIRNKYQSQDPIYISAVNYGRKGIIMVESEYSYEELSVAIRASFNAGIVSGGLNLSVAQKKMLQEAQITIVIIGGESGDAVKTIKGFEEFQNFIINGGVYTKEVFGTPISFEGAHASHNGMFMTEFDVQY